ncbi:MAG: ABC transporter ATP-binding protein [Candidatus Aminicenantes bacterium RBG_13_63_10]|nr:MAG: ABC transporter ATP-binding protein [Candidatus Aminicenantes bacterium RBG_13_63_10]
MLEARNLTKVYQRGSEEVVALEGISLKVRKGEFLAFVGPSGSGKTTLVNILGCLDNPTSGILRLRGRDVFREGKRLPESRLTKIRREVFGYVFQRFYLVPTLTVAENIALPFAFFRKPGSLPDPLAAAKLLGLEKRLNHKPGQLSGGEMQRTAIARALVNDPEIILADEPTGNLDTARSREIGRTLERLNREKGLTILLVTHNLELARSAQRVLELRDGRLVKPGSMGR